MAADKVSYAWDKLIEKFNYYAMRGEQHFVTGGGIKDTERVLRFMAREPRWKRRYLATCILEMLKTTLTTCEDYEFFPQRKKGTAFLFLLLPMHASITHEQYRIARRSFLEDCCVVARLEYSDAKDIVGIATESGANHSQRSEDAIYFDASGWNAKMEGDARNVQENLGYSPRQNERKDIYRNISNT